MPGEPAQRRVPSRLVLRRRDDARRGSRTGGLLEADRRRQRTFRHAGSIRLALLLPLICGCLPHEGCHRETHRRPTLGDRVLVGESEGTSRPLRATSAHADGHLQVLASLPEHQRDGLRLCAFWE